MDGWTGVELRHLAALSAINEERSFRGAADRLGYVQSAVSQQIAQLEALVGVRLVHRVRGKSPPVLLTSAGLLLLEHAGRILAQFSAAEADLRAHETGGSGAIRIGADNAVSTRLLPRVLLRLAHTDPSMTVHVEDVPSGRGHAAQVMSGELDAAIGELPLLGQGLVCAEVLVDPCVLLVPATSPLARADSGIDLAALVAQPLVALDGWPMLELIESHLRSAGYEPRYATRARASSTVQAFVGAGIGSAVLPRLAVNQDDPGVAVVELGELFPARRLSLYWQEDRCMHLAALSALRGALLTVAREVTRSYRRDKLAVADVAASAPRPALAVC